MIPAEHRRPATAMPLPDWETAPARSWSTIRCRRHGGVNEANPYSLCVAFRRVAEGAEPAVAGNRIGCQRRYRRRSRPRLAAADSSLRSLGGRAAGEDE